MMIETETKKKNSDVVYRYGDGLYLNITSRCPTACEFCIKFSWGYRYRGYNLLLPKEPTVQEVLSLIKNPLEFSEIIFCGYGESTYRLDAMKEIAGELRRRGAKKIRLNTIGLGNLIHGRSIASDLSEFLDEISISLNTTDPQEWVQIHRPLPEFKINGFESVLQFIRECSQVIHPTIVTTVEKKGIDLDSMRSFVQSLGATFRCRPYLGEYENQ